ncbi:MAG TPA: hypothetical protein VK783_08610 [Bacteroidia bacterium]|jgi:hypothetical protein|nr:hypothetical protein [Bacteroidia bacterium]
MKRSNYFLLASILLLFSQKAYSQSWSGVGTGVNGTINCMVVYDSALYVGGNFDSAGGISANSIAKWDGTKWSALGMGVRLETNSVFSSATVEAMCVFKGLLYVSGNFNFAGNDSVSGLTAYNGSTWTVNNNSGKWDCVSMVTNDTLMYLEGNSTVAIFNGTSIIGGQCFLCINQTFCDEKVMFCRNMALYNNSVAIGGWYLDTNSTGGLALPTIYYPYSGPNITLGALGPGKSWNILNQNDEVSALMGDSNLLYVGLNNTVSVYNGTVLQ